MRYMTVNLYMDWQSFHPVEHRLAREPALRRKALHSIKLLDDDTIALLAEVEGDLDRYREIMRESPEVERFTVSGDDSGFCYSQTRVTEPSREMFRRREQGDFIIEMPIEYTDDGGMHMTIVGEEADLLAVSGLFDDVDLELVSTGPYFPGTDGVFGELTDRQQEVLATAVRLGYYENPREATLADLAAELDVDPATVGKHLRTVESKVFAEYVP
jgi:predicted DNA binding protein